MFKKIIALLLIISMLFIIVSCRDSNNHKSDSTIQESIQETDAETSENANPETDRIVNYLQAKIDIYDDENQKGNYLVYLSFTNASYKDVFGITNEEYKRETDLCKLVGFAFKWDRKNIVDICERFNQIYGDVRILKQVFETDFDFDDIFDQEIQLGLSYRDRTLEFYPDFGSDELYNLYESYLDKTEYLIESRNNSQHQENPWHTYVMTFYYGNEYAEKVLGIVFADSLEEAKEIHLLDENVNLVAYVSEVLDHRPKNAVG